MDLLGMIWLMLRGNCSTDFHSLFRKQFKDRCRTVIFRGETFAYIHIRIQTHMPHIYRDLQY